MEKLSSQNMITASKIDRAIPLWEKMGRYAKCRNFFLLVSRDGVNEKQFTELAQLDAKYLTYRDYYICGRMEYENGR
ncbi:MAG: hypothetical protein AABX83_03410 [Nanoarchaeota archaeon]